MLHPPTVLERTSAAGLTARLAEDAGRARAFASQATAVNTKRAYRADWADFCAWCDDRGLPALPAAPETVTLYVASRAEVGPNGADGRPTPGLKVSTLERRLSAVNQAHRQTGHAAPASRREEPLHSVWAGITRTKGVAPEKVAPALPDDLRHMVEALPRDVNGEWTLAAKRDRALLLLGFAGALRRSELVAVDVAHVQFTADGLRLHLPRSKADQEGRGATLGIHYGQSPQTCPVRSLRSWLQAAREATGSPLAGPVFRKVDRWGRLWETELTSGAVAKLVKRAARRPASTRRSTAGIACGPGSRPRRRGRASTSGLSCDTRGTRASVCCASTSVRAPCSKKTQPTGSDYDRRY